VEDIVENVKDTMDDTVTMVKQSVDLHYQTEQHPWLMLSGSVLVGYMLGGLGRRSTTTSDATTLKSHATMPDSLRSGYYATVPGTEYATVPSPEPDGRPFVEAQPAESRPSGLWTSTLGQFKEEFDIIKGAVIGALMSNVRDVIKESMPNLAPQIEKAINSATAKLGAQPGGEAEPQAKNSPEQATAKSGNRTENRFSGSAAKREHRDQVAL
jgi:hypothetical protein